MTNAAMGGYRPSPTRLSTEFLIRGSARGVVSMPAVHDIFSPIKDTQ